MQVWVGVAGEAPQGAVPLMRMVIPVFKADTEAAPVRFAKPQYPVGSQHRSESAHVDLRYLVREDGKPDPASIEILSVVVQTNRPVGPVAEGFGASAVKAIADSRFHPAMVRGCPVRSTVVQRISFRIG